MTTARLFGVKQMKGFLKSHPLASLIAVLLVLTPAISVLLVLLTSSSVPDGGTTSIAVPKAESAVAILAGLLLWALAALVILVIRRKDKRSEVNDSEGARMQKASVY